LIVVTMAFVPGDALGQGGVEAGALEARQAIVEQYCALCHDDGAESGGFAWSSIDLAHPDQNADLVERMIRKIRSGLMPPAGSPRPDIETMNGFAAGLEAQIDEVARTRPYVRSPELHRMNRTEYQNAVRDLLGVHVDVNELLPPDARTSSGVSGGGFDNMSEALTITPALMGAYVRAADKISRAAFGDPNADAGMKTYKVSRLQNQMRHVPGTPVGTRGGVSVLHTFPADGEYIFDATPFYYYTELVIGSSLPDEMQGQQLEISVDGEPLAVLTIDPDVKESAADYSTPPVFVKAGQRRLSAAFISKFDGPVQDHNRLVEYTIIDTTISTIPEMTDLPHLQALAVTGPFNPAGVSDNPVRERVFTCRPASDTENEGCATRIISRLAGRAFRRPANDEDLESLMEFYRRGEEAGGFDEGVRAAVQVILAKPEFIFRFERTPADAEPGQSYRISDLELASRLAYFLWSTIPDEELVELANDGRLQDPEILEQQVTRMLADRRSEALATNFASQWLRLTGLEGKAPESLLYPDFTRQLAGSMRREIELLFSDIIGEDRNVLDLLTADDTFLDETLARHYSVNEVVGTGFRKVYLSDPVRFGLLGKAGILTLTSFANRTSPVARGKYVLEVLLGSSPPLPPPSVPPLDEQVDNQRILTVRQRMERHRSNPACASCHKIVDPIGMALENFDAIGVWRAKDGGIPIDPTGEMYDGFELDGPRGLRAAVLNRSKAFLGTFTENLMTYGVGRVLDYRDMPTVRTIARDAERDDNRFSAFIMGIVKSATFQMRSVGSMVVDAN
jgi:cytochrome c551/c552